jgi:hypothetical protein
MAREPPGCSWCLLQMTEERLAARRPVGAPPISVVCTIEQSELWGSTQVDIPFEPANDIVGAALSCNVFKRLPEDTTWLI